MIYRHIALLVGDSHYGWRIIFEGRGTIRHPDREQAATIAQRYQCSPATLKQFNHPSFPIRACVVEKSWDLGFNPADLLGQNPFEVARDELDAAFDLLQQEEALAPSWHQGRAS